MLTKAKIIQCKWRELLPKNVVESKLSLFKSELLPWKITCAFWCKTEVNQTLTSSSCLNSELYVTIQLDLDSAWNSTQDISSPRFFIRMSSDLYHPNK